MTSDHDAIMCVWCEVNGKEVNSPSALTSQDKMMDQLEVGPLLEEALSLRCLLDALKWSTVLKIALKTDPKMGLSSKKKWSQRLGEPADGTGPGVSDRAGIG